MLAGKINSADVFRFVPNYKKSKIYHERNKGSIKTANTVKSALSFITLPYVGIRRRCVWSLTIFAFIGSKESHDLHVK